MSAKWRFHEIDVTCNRDRQLYEAALPSVPTVANQTSLTMTHNHTSHRTPPPVRPLTHTRVLSLALNLPGPAALMRLQAMGAQCIKLEPPGLDPMAHYSPEAYGDMHQGIDLIVADLKTPDGQHTLHATLARTDVLVTSFRPSALRKLKLDFPTLHALYPQLVMVTIVGAPGDRADEPGHDLTYMAEQDLVQGLSLPPTLYADMGGALAASEAVLKGLLVRHQTGSGCEMEVALSDAAAWLGKPRKWALTTPTGDVGGGHAGYGVYPCQDGRVAVAALEPHFASRLCGLAGLNNATHEAMRSPAHHASLAQFFSERTRQQLDHLASDHDLPLHTLPPDTEKL